MGDMLDRVLLYRGLPCLFGLDRLIYLGLAMFIGGCRLLIGGVRGG
jgi:hypothetical protein